MVQADAEAEAEACKTKRGTNGRDAIESEQADICSRCFNSNDILLAASLGGESCVIATANAHSIVDIIEAKQLHYNCVSRVLILVYRILARPRDLLLLTRLDDKIRNSTVRLRLLDNLPCIYGIHITMISSMSSAALTLSNTSIFSHINRETL